MNVSDSARGSQSSGRPETVDSGGRRLGHSSPHVIIKNPVRSFIGTRGRGVTAYARGLCRETETGLIALSPPKRTNKEYDPERWITRLVDR